MPVTKYAEEMSQDSKRKVLAVTASTALVAVVVSFFITITSVIILLVSNENTADKILDCTVPTGRCYVEKINDSRTEQAVVIGSIIEYCARISNSSPVEIRKCVEKELVK